jgi:hypothetical protein
MSEQFTVKIEVTNTEKPAREFISKLAAALGEDDYAAVRQLASAALASAPRGRDAKALVAPLLLSCSEYGPAEVSFLDALCGALEDASAYLQVGGSKKLNIELGGTDNGTADAAAYLLALLLSLQIDGLEATGKGFTWMAKWACDAHGNLQTASYEPLDEGQRIDPKADEKLRRKVKKENEQFLASPLRRLVDALPTELPMGLINAVGLDQILGCQYTELIAQIAALPDWTGHQFLVGISGQILTARKLGEQLRIHVWNAPGDKQFLELELRTELPYARLKKHFKALLREHGYKQDLNNIGWFDWKSNGIDVNVRLHSSMFELRLTRPA